MITTIFSFVVILEYHGGEINKNYLQNKVSVYQKKKEKLCYFRVSIAVRRQHDHGNHYKENHLIGAELQF